MRINPLAASLLIGLSGCQTAEITPDTPHLAEGHGEVPTYVEAICADCHAVTADTISPHPQAPGFADIANSPGVTHDTLVTFLSDAHNYPLQMDVDLDEEDIEVIADYIITLQSDDYHKTPS
ncbi:MAG: hypothetical protein ACM308_05090 [Qipengyuania vulgaris]